MMKSECCGATEKPPLSQKTQKIWASHHNTSQRSTNTDHVERGRLQLHHIELLAHQLLLLNGHAEGDVGATILALSLQHHTNATAAAVGRSDHMGWGHSLQACKAFLVECISRRWAWLRIRLGLWLNTALSCSISVSIAHLIYTASHNTKSIATHLAQSPVHQSKWSRQQSLQGPVHTVGHQGMWRGVQQLGKIVGDVDQSTIAVRDHHALGCSLALEADDEEPAVDKLPRLEVIAS